MGGSIESLCHLRVNVDHKCVPASRDEHAACENFLSAQRRLQMTDSAEARQAAKAAYRKLLAAMGFDPDSAQPSHGWEFRP